jgi:hypothetical protein
MEFVSILRKTIEEQSGEFLRPISLNDGYPVFTWFAP